MDNEKIKSPAEDAIKMRSDSVWPGLMSEQRKTVDGWLSEEGRGYAEVAVTDNNGYWPGGGGGFAI